MFSFVLRFHFQICAANINTEQYKPHQCHKDVIDSFVREMATDWADR